MIPLVAPKIEDDDIMILQNYAKPELLTSAVLELEAEMSTRIDKKYALAVNSGTSALHLSLLALKVGAGDEVICPTYTCTAILNAIMYLKAIPVLVDCNYDVEESNFSMSFQQTRSKISDKTKAIIFPHMFGKVTILREFKELGIPIIEDGTLSLGATNADVQVGSQGVISLFSFHESKMISAISGGMILTNDYDLYQSMRNYIEEDNHNKTFSIRYNYRMPLLNAALASNQLTKLDKFIDYRRCLAKYYTERLRQFEFVGVPSITDDNIYFRYIVALTGGIAPEILLKKCAEKGIQLGRGVYPPLHHLLSEGAHKYPNAELAVRTLVSIPIHPSVNPSNAEYIVNTLIDELMLIRSRGQ